MFAIQTQRLGVTSVSQFIPPLMALNVCHMPDRMSQLESITLRAINTGSFLIVPKRGIVAMQVPFNLTEPGQSLRQLPAHATSPAKLVSILEPPIRLVEPIFPAPTKAPLYQAFSFIRHRHPYTPSLF
jgi:hypothetical protein